MSSLGEDVDGPPKNGSDSVPSILINGTIDLAKLDGTFHDAAQIS